MRNKPALYTLISEFGKPGLTFNTQRTEACSDTCTAGPGGTPVVFRKSVPGHRCEVCRKKHSEASRFRASLKAKAKRVARRERGK